MVTHDSAITFKLSATDKKKFIESIPSRVTPIKTAKADVLRAFVKAYNDNPVLYNSLLRDYM
jgi:hypothetical protein